MSLSSPYDILHDSAPNGRQQWLSLLLATLYVLANVFPSLHVLLPGDPTSIVAGAPSPARPAAGPSIWFPLAYALSGFPTGPAPTASHPVTQLHHREGVAPFLAWIIPALPARAGRWSHPPAGARRSLHLAGPCLAPSDLSLPDPPPRLPQAPARAPSAV
jgi:hypothetical protein